MNNLTARIASALNLAGPYLDACLTQRNPGPGALGSVFLTAQTRETILAADWMPFDHPEVKAPAVAFRANIPGIVGVVNLATLPPNTRVILADPKGTGYVEATAMLPEGPEVTYTTILLGPARDGSGETLWTIFPGEPVSPSRVSADGRNNLATTAREALALGMTVAKVARA
jgi:hypothetical protein